MRKNLFLTGPIGSGKSTGIAAALGENLSRAGGFLTVRQRDGDGNPVAFWLKRPDGSRGEIIIDPADKTCPVRMEVFEGFGTELLEQARSYAFVVLDEIGGAELLSDRFLEALMELLKSDVPCIGVVKGAEPAGRMIRKLGLGEAYGQRAEKLRQWIRQDENTLLYECGQFDPEGLRLAREWVSQYCK